MRIIKRYGYGIKKAIGAAFLKIAIPTFLKVHPGRYISFHNTLSDKWKMYRIGNKLHELKKNMDKESCGTIDLILERYRNILLPTKYHKYVVYNEKIVFTKDEIDLRDKIKKHMKKVKFTLSKDEYSESVFYYESGLIFIKNRRKYLRGKTIIDGGAYIGDNILVFSRYNPSNIIAFEPNKKNIILLKRTLSLNKLNVIVDVIEAGIGRRAGFADLYLDGSSSTMMETENLKKDRIKIVRIDDYASNLNVGLIKLDIEGNEYNAIKGAIKTIKKSRPILLISIYHTPKDFFEIKPYLERNLDNYKYLIRKCDPYHPVYETMLIAYPEEIE